MRDVVVAHTCKEQRITGFRGPHDKYFLLLRVHEDFPARVVRPKLDKRTAGHDQGEGGENADDGLEGSVNGAKPDHAAGNNQRQAGAGR